MQYIGWVGTFFGLLSFCLLSLGLLKQESKLFSASIVISSSCFFTSSLMISNYQGVAANIFYFISSCLAVGGIVLHLKWVNEKIFYTIGTLIFVVAALIYLPNNDWLFQSIGWVCVFSLPMAFFMFTQNKITQLKFFYLNTGINILFVTHFLYYHNYPLAVCQVVALIFSIYGFLRILYKKEEMMDVKS